MPHRVMNTSRTRLLLLLLPLTVTISNFLGNRPPRIRLSHASRFRNTPNTPGSAVSPLSGPILYHTIRQDNRFNYLRILRRNLLLPPELSQQSPWVNSNS
ncbi:hypothetical protein RND81_02G109700 [Saponaria officinalis]|uniref:Secreted protein n=1 Tax=Saponaria officinalis TaxID=3572 RepID=A0AAW1MS50_SAPOF